MLHSHAAGDRSAGGIEGNEAAAKKISELDKPPEKRQPFGTKAKQFTSEHAFGKDVTVIVKDTDKYGRTVAEVILPDGKNLNEELVYNGFAWWYRSSNARASRGPASNVPP